MNEIVNDGSFNLLRKRRVDVGELQLQGVKVPLAIGKLEFCNNTISAYIPFLGHVFQFPGKERPSMWTQRLLAPRAPHSCSLPLSLDPTSAAHCSATHGIRSHFFC